jgi:hypothetical protein
MTLLAVWMAHISHRARQQKLAVEKVHRLGGTVYYDYQIKTNGLVPDTFDFQAIPPGPAWLRNILGDDYFQAVVSISFNKTAVADEDLSLLLDTPVLKVLDLGDTKITDDGLACVKNLNKLEFLFLRHTSVGDRGLKQLKDLAHLRGLDISDTKVTDEGIKQLQAACPNIEITRVD